jgi:hypothetical protein
LASGATIAILATNDASITGFEYLIFKS